MQLAAKETELKESATKLESIAAEESSLTAEFDEALGALEQQRAVIAADDEGHTAALVALAALRENAAAAKAAAENDRTHLLQQVRV